MGMIYAFDIVDLMMKYGLRYYFETGTGVGDSLGSVVDLPFEKLYSVDIDEDLVNQCLAKFSGYEDKLTIYNGTSEEILEKHITEIPQDAPTLFFLDAHFPGADFHKMSYEESIRTYTTVAFPLENEIAIIKSQRDMSRDVIILDDLMLYEPGDGYQSKWEYSWLQEELQLATSSQFIYDAFEDTHNFTKDFRHQGYLVITPKKA